MSPEVTSVSIDVDAPPEAVYALVSDLPRMGSWSPECVRCVWKGGATEAAPGARFKGYNRRGVRRWSTSGTVVEAEPGRRLTFDVTSVFGLPVARWSYLIEPRDGGSRVTESTEDRRGGLIKVLGRLTTGVGDRATHNAATMRTTLERVKAEAEASAGV
jgi:uncharacterized protein YndB with AHSA1/START domain